MDDRIAHNAIIALSLAAVWCLAASEPSRAALPADLAVEIQRVATNYQKRLQRTRNRQRGGLDRALAATIVRNDLRVAEAALTAAVCRGITRNSAFTEELVGVAVGAAPSLRPGLVRRLEMAFPGFRPRIRRAAVADPRLPPFVHPVQARPVPVRRTPARVVLRQPPPRNLETRIAAVRRAPVTGPAKSAARLDEPDELNDEDLDASQLAAANILAGDPTNSPGPSPVDSDPWEGFNRAMFTINDTLDQYVLRPTTWVYRLVVPRIARLSLRNAFRNLASPARLANELLQAEMVEAGVTVSRFVINTTFGLAGLFDVATELGLPFHPADFGETLNSYDVGAGPYLVLPLLGSGSIRHGAGRIIDKFFNPINYLFEFPVSGGLAFGQILTRRDEVFSKLGPLRDSTVDYYAAIRSLHYQDRAGFLRRRSDGRGPPARAANRDPRQN